MNRFVLSLALLAIIFFTSSCDDSDEIIGEEIISDKKPPEVNLLNPTNGTRVKGTLTISASAEDQSEKVFMQLFVDDMLLSSDSTKQIEADLDTKTISEGVHKIVVNAKDENGNSSSKEFSFEVRNTLVTIQVPYSYVPQFARIFYVLSKNNGDLIAYGEVENETVISIPTPEDFNPDSSFVYSEYFHLDDGYTFVKSANAYPAMEAGCYRYYEIPRGSSANGKHKLKITDLSNAIQIRTQGKSAGYTLGYAAPQNDFVEWDLFMYDTSSDLFIDAVDTRLPAQYPFLYYYNENIEAGGSTNISLDDFSPMEKHSIKLREPVDEYSTTVEGYFEETILPYNVSSFYGLEQASTAEVYAPVNLFEKLKTHISLLSGDLRYTNDVIGSSVPTSFQYLDVKLKDISRSDNQVQVETSGEFDVLIVNASYNNYTGDRLILKNFAFHFPGGIHKLTIPKNLPQELIDLGFEDLTTLGFTTANFSDYFDIDGRDDYKNYIVFSADGKPRGSRPSIGKAETLAPAATERINAQSNKKFAKVEPVLERLNLQYLVK